MVTQAENETLVRVGPGTDVGELMRRYWHPVATSAQLPDPDCKPLRTKLLGQRLVVFRDTDGNVGVMNELCMHRGASLALGRVEEGGIRCLYHGWKFAVDGTILETPNHADCRYRERMKAPAYPVVERSGLIWTYIGAKEHQPPFRTFAADEVPPENQVVIRINMKANYLQLWEGGVDSSHVSTLHTNQARKSWSAERGAEVDVTEWTPMDDPAPLFEAEDTPFGYHYAATRRLPPGRENDQIRNVRITPAIFPTGRIIRGPIMDFLVWETPDDDYSTSTYITVYAQQPIERDWIKGILGIDDPRVWDEGDCNYKGTWENGFFQDRDSMELNWTGLKGLEQEDAAIGLSYGPIFDRTEENLVTADLAVVKLRRRILQAARDVKEGRPALGAFISDLTSVAAPDEDVPAGTDWRSLAPFHREFGKEMPVAV
jgi:phenylpropionate dioxygenase-like ring-hydroxylating dioxygenase large terminal subunit